MKYQGHTYSKKVFVVYLNCTFNWCLIFNLATSPIKPLRKKTFLLISPRHLGTYFYVFLQGRAQPSESFSSSVINKGISRLAFPSASCPGCQCYLSEHPTYPGIKPQISTVPPILYNQFELGKMPALKKNAPTLVTMEIRGKEKK